LDVSFIGRYDRYFDYDGSGLLKGRADYMVKTAHQSLGQWLSAFVSRKSLRGLGEWVLVVGRSENEGGEAGLIGARELQLHPESLDKFGATPDQDPRLLDLPFKVTELDVSSRAGWTPWKVKGRVVRASDSRGVLTEDLVIGISEGSGH